MTRLCTCSKSCKCKKRPCKNQCEVLNNCKTMPWYPQKLGTSLFYFVGVVAYYFPGVSITKPDGTDRFRSDVFRARDIWNFPFVPVGAVQLTLQEANVISLQQSDVHCSEQFLNTRARQLMQIRRVTDSTCFFKDLITVWYVPFDTFADGMAVGCAWSNIGSQGSEQHHIFVTENANNSSNLSLLAHELGHILFGTVPKQDNSDPTGPDITTLIQKKDGTTTVITPLHSLNEDNVMYPTPGNRTVVERSQLEKMVLSRLVQVVFLR